MKASGSIIIFYLILMGITSSCEETLTNVVDVDRSHLQPKGVIFGMLSNSDPLDSIFQEGPYTREAGKTPPGNRIYISNSSPSNHSRHKFYEANIIIRTEDRNLPLRYFAPETIHGSGDPYYGIMEELKAGEIYQFTAQWDSTSGEGMAQWGPISAVDTMPNPIPIAVVDAGIKYPDLKGSQSQGYMDIIIEDEPYIRNMYQVEVSVIQSKTDEYGRKYDIIIPATVKGGDDRVSSEVFGTYHLNLIHEAEFTRKGEKRIEFGFHTNHGLFNKKEPVSLMIRFSNLSGNCVEFLKSSRQYFAMGENPFAEPAEIYSNVNNGYGIFACVARSYAKYKIE